MESGIRWDLSWKRPENVPYPKVWHVFETISKKTACKYKIKIQDIPPDRFDECIHFMETNFDRIEPITKAYELWDDSESIMAYRTIRRKIMEQKISLMAVIDDENNLHSKSELMGVLLLSVKSKTDPPTKQTGTKLNKIFDVLERIENGLSPFQLLQADNYIYHYGVSVASKYYGLGCALELEKQVSFIGKACGISGSCIVFTSNYSLPFLKKLGCTFLNEVQYEQLKNENGESIFPNVEVDGTSGVFAIWKYS